MNENDISEKSALCYHCKRAFKVDDATEACQLSVQGDAQTTANAATGRGAEDASYTFFSLPRETQRRTPEAAAVTSTEYTHPAFAASDLTCGSEFRSLSHVAQRTRCKRLRRRSPTRLPRSQQWSAGGAPRQRSPP
ncbi:hypothetical protein STCU_12208 [Strigomonas culicis]|uniref:Uncharacterized protein n=1 Tax=Strigomonas culicis TaxID=28005 RepID=S9TE57_9TRYP|nr:hypothetical protein STCU_12208 [Strigomonas culicis]|eukprot:EPY15244.1 hypothetical protein STCU_12208 [Strigomonas culicis]